MTPEAKVKNKVKKILDSLGCYHFSPQTGGYGKSGIPDIIACYKGRFIAIECKAGKGQVTALQKYNIDQIITLAVRAGYEARDREVRNAIEKICDENDDGMWSGRELMDTLLTHLNRNEA